MIRVDKELSKIRALIVEDFQTGVTRIEYDKRKFEEILGYNTFWEVTKVFELTKENKDILTNKLIAKSEFNEEDKLTTSLTDFEMIRDILPLVTDIPYDLEIESDKEELNELLINPTGVFELVLSVVSKMLMSVMTNFMSDIESIDNLPKDALDLLKLSVEKDKLQEQLNEEKELTNVVSEIEELVK